MSGNPQARFGIRSRLSLSLGLLALLAVTACLVGWLSFAQVRKAVESITTESLPTTLLSREIAEYGARLAAAAPSLAASESQDQREQAHQRVQADLLEVEALVDQWVDRTEATPESASRLVELVRKLGVSLHALDVASAGRLEIQSQRFAAQKRLAQGHEHLLEQLEPLIDDTVFELAMQAEGRRPAQGVNARQLDALMVLKAESNRAVGLLLEAANIPDLESLTPLRERLDAATGQMTRAAGKLPGDARFNALRDATGTLLQESAEGSSIVELRQAELEFAQAASQQLQDNYAHSAALLSESRRLFQSAYANNEATVSTADQRIAAGKLAFLLISLASLLGALLVTRAYVHPRIAQPIADITETMTRLAEGDTDIEIPAEDRDDEIGRMAKALRVFRDMTVQIQRSNLQEIDAARKRLSDAIESISEAFTLFDPDDRLVVYNRMFLDMVHPENRDLVRPGISFEELLRNALARSAFPDAVGNEEAWLAERLQIHRNPGEPHIQQSLNGTWLMISERRTSEGGYVAVYSDITELKERENELASQSQALENLSNQLSKYLSPQVYQSIFTGKQTARVASQRKKLTVFFSDIAGFTEAADRLESEDLTGLLNEYLTEMSRIALEHGATIDKFIGDAIMIFFGDPVSKGVKEDAIACVRMAIAMRNRLKELASIWADAGLGERLITRIGIHTGFCTVGNFGSEDRMDYTIIGGAVNEASRLESAAPPGAILISQDTYTLIHGVVHCIEHETLRLKGMAYPVKTYLVVDTHEALGSQSGHIFQHRPHWLLDANLEAMDEEQRREVRKTLEGVLQRLESTKNDMGSDNKEPE